MTKCHHSGGPWEWLDVLLGQSRTCGFNYHPVTGIQGSHHMGQGEPGKPLIWWIGAGPLGPENQVAVKGIMGFPLAMETWFLSIIVYLAW